MTTVLDSDLAYGNPASDSFVENQVWMQGPVQDSSAKVLTGRSLAKFTVVGMNAAGKLIAWDPTATTPDVDAYATGTLTFGGQPTAADTLTINGHAITFRASGAGANEVNIGADAAATAQNVKTLINAAPLTYLMTATGAAAVLALQATTAGTAGNAYTLAKSGTYPSLSAATLTGGDTGFTVPAPEATVAGVLLQPVDATSADNDGQYRRMGVAAWDKLVWPGSITTLALAQAACRGSQLWVEKLK